MAFDNGNGVVATMPVAPTGYGYGYNGGGFGGFGGDGWWIILLLLCGWGGFGGMGGMNMMWPMMMNGGMMGGMGLYPWLDNSQNTNEGFRDTLLGIAGVNQNISATGSAITGAVRDGFYSAEIGANNRAMANMQQIFGVQSGLSDVKYTIGQEGCADRAAVANALNTLLMHVDQKVQGVQDKLCQLELDNVKAQYAAEQRENSNLRTELMYARGQASQIEQTAALREGQITAVDSLYNRLKNCPVPSQPVYGSQPIFNCNNGAGCGCGNVA